jgi:hypothetical protein
MAERKPDPDGGPAFPITAGNNVYATGMFLRDWFAGQAMAGLMANPSIDTGTMLDAARSAYDIADAMLEEREKADG